MVDGNSTDGTRVYLQQLYDRGQIHQYFSAPDKNQAHGWNRAMLMARGLIIKKIIDDDVFCYQAIRACKAYMLQHPEIDAVISNELYCSLATPEKIGKGSRFTFFQEWKNGSRPVFTFGDVHLLLRRSSLSLIGLYNTTFVNIDWEYSLRMTSLKIIISYYAGYNALSVSHPGTVSSQREQAVMKEEGRIGVLLYNYTGDRSEISRWSKMKIFVGKLLKGRREVAGSSVGEITGLEAIYDRLYQYIDEQNRDGGFTFY